MRLKGLTVLALTGLMLCLAFYPQGSAAAPKGPVADESTIVLHFKGQGFSIQPPKPGNSTEETVNCPGRPYGGRRTGTIIGEWTFLPRGNFQMQGSFKAELWAKSESGAKNAGFRLNLYEGDSLYQGYFSDRVELSTPHKFQIAGSATLSCRAGVQVKVGLVWLSDPNLIVGPSGGGTFMYGSMDHDSTVSFTLAAPPCTMNLTTIDKEKDALKINARVNDSLGLDPASLTYKVTIVGPATVLPEHLSVPNVAGGDNGTSVSWLWSFRKSRAQSGMYTMTITVYYTNDTFFSTGNQTQISIEAQQTTDIIKAITSSGTFLPMMAVIILLAVLIPVISFVVIRRRRKKKARMMAEAEMAAAA